MRGIRPSRSRTARPGAARGRDTAVLLRLLERELQAEADAEHRPPGGDTLAQRFVEPAAQPSIAEAAEPTPGSTARSAVATSSASRVAPRRSNASATERTLPAP